MQHRIKQTTSMSKEKANNDFAAFDEYLRQGEPSQKESAENWKTAIGLQAVDGLQPSAYLIDVAKRNIEGEISLDETRKLIDSYYQSKTVRTPKDEDEYDISKKEWVLEGDSVNYLNWEDLRRALDWDIEQEKNFQYKGLTDDEKIEHIAKFISGIWQTHAFREGNTRTTAIFTIQYLRSLGYEVNNDMFAQHSWYFRNALVRANYRNIQKGIEYSPVYLVRFFRNLLLKDGWVLKNRYLHIRPTDDWKEQPNLKDPHYNKTLQKVDRKGGQKTEKVGRKGGQKTKVSIIRMIKDNPSISSIEMANLIGINRSAISKHLKKLKEDHIIKREGPAKGGKWIIITS